MRPDLILATSAIALLAVTAAITGYGVFLLRAALKAQEATARAAQEATARAMYQISELLDRSGNRLASIERHLAEMIAVSRLLADASVERRDAATPGAGNWGRSEPGARITSPRREVSAPDATEPRDGRGPDFGTSSTAASSPIPGRAVELDNGVLIVSRSLAAVGLLVAPSHGGEAQLYLNPEVQIDEFSLDAWRVWFDFDFPRANQFFRTVSPAVVAWNEAAGRGELIARGTAEVVT